MKNKTVFISGGTKGIGKGIVINHLKKGFNISTFSRNNTDCDNLKKELQKNFDSKNYLIESGVHFGLMTDHPVTLARQLFLQTRWFTRAGLSKQQAIELVSRKNAEILGIQDILCLGGS